MIISLEHLKYWVFKVRSARNLTANLKSQSKCISRKSGLMPFLKTNLNWFAIEQSVYIYNKTFENVLRHGIRLYFSWDTFALKVQVWDSITLFDK